MCNKVKARGAPATAVHIRDIVKQVYAFAILHGEKVDNPADDVKAASIATFAPKDRSLSPTEIRLMCRQLESVATYPTIRLALRLIVLTLVRKSELIEATWSEVDFENATWTIPKSDERVESACRLPVASSCRPFHRAAYLRRWFEIHSAVALRRGPLHVESDVEPGDADCLRTLQDRRPAAGAVHSPRSATHRLDVAQRGWLQRRLDIEGIGARGRSFLALGLQQGRVRRRWLAWLE